MCNAKELPVRHDRRAAPRIRRAAAAGLGVEPLEERTLYAAATSTDFSVPTLNGISVSLDSAYTLQVGGTAAADEITISDSPVQVLGSSSRNLVITAKNSRGTLTVTKYGVKDIDVETLEGADKVTVSTSLAATLDGGSGNDTLTGGSGADRIYGDAGDDWVYGKGGADVLDGEVGDDRLYAYWYTSGGSSSDRDTIYGGDDDDTVVGGSGDDRLDGGDDDDVLYGCGGVDLVFGGEGQDVLDGGDDGDYLDGLGGDDRVYGGEGDDQLSGGDGDDTLVSIGGGQRDSIYGGSGTDSFWVDAEVTEDLEDDTSSEVSGGHVHAVASFMTLRVEDGLSTMSQAVDRELDGPSLLDPLVWDTATDAFDHWENFGYESLFAAAGPTADDVDQNGLGDCYLLASLSAAAMRFPDLVRQMVVDLGDGTYAVRFRDSGTDTFVRVDADLPVGGAGAPIYAGLGQEDSLWVAIVEKAFAFYRTNEGTYDSLNFGSSASAFELLGLSADYVARPDLFGEAFASLLLVTFDMQLRAGNAVTICTPDDGTSLLVANHCYSLSSVDVEAGTVTLRNPWASGGLDGYVTLSIEDLWADMQGYVAASL